MKYKYKDLFRFNTHIENSDMPVSKSCRINIEKPDCNCVLIEFETSDRERRATIYVAISDDGIPFVELGIGEDEQVSAGLIGNKWVLKKNAEN